MLLEGVAQICALWSLLVFDGLNVETRPTGALAMTSCGFQGLHCVGFERRFPRECDPELFFSEGHGARRFTRKPDGSC